MKTWQIIALDDLEAAEKRQVPATHTVTVGWQGTSVELDLNDENFERVKAFMVKLVKAGHQPGEMATPKGSQSQSYFKGMRDWADNQGRSSEYIKCKSGFRYEIGLRRDYDAYLASQAGG